MSLPVCFDIVSLVVILPHRVCDSWVYQFPKRYLPSSKSLNQKLRGWLPIEVHDLYSETLGVIFGDNYNTGQDHRCEV